jgi:nucleotide-binding universal stress UspA family protein
MNTILIATDFSDAAHNAVIYGIELAKTFKANVILFNAYQQVPFPVTEGPVIFSPEEMREIAREQLAREEQILDRPAVLSIKTIYEESMPAAGILKAAKDHNADLIIVGMAENNKGWRKVLGSTAVVVARKTKIPLLVVPAQSRFAGVETIAFATDRDLDQDADIHLLDRLRELTERFRSRLYLVRVAKSKFEAALDVLNRPFRLNSLLQPFDPEYICVEGKDTMESLNSFINDRKVNVLALLPHAHSLLERWFLKSTTRTAIFESAVPLLVLPDLKQ